MTTIAELPGFSKLHPHALTYRPCPGPTIEKYKGVLPAILIESWTKSGFQSFSNSFLWMVDPDEYREVIGDFVYPKQRDEVHVILRTAFGTLLIWYRGRAFFVSPSTQVQGKLGTLEFALEFSFARKPYVNTMFFFSIFKAAKKKLGPVAEGEVYGLVPALALGGEMEIDNLQKVNLRAHLHLLSQLYPAPAQTDGLLLNE